MISERFKNNKNLSDSFNNVLMDGSKDVVYNRPFCYINCSIINFDRNLLVPIIVRPQNLRSNEMSNPNNYSILAASSKKEASKMCKGQMTLVPNYTNVVTIGVSHETYDRIKRESDKLIREILKEIGNEYQGVGFKSELALTNAVNDAFSEFNEIYTKSFDQNRENDYYNDCYERNDDSSYNEYDNYRDYDYDEIGDDNGDGLIDGMDYPGPEW